MLSLTTTDWSDAWCLSVDTLLVISAYLAGVENCKAQHRRHVCAFAPRSKLFVLALNWLLECRREKGRAVSRTFDGVNETEQERNAARGWSWAGVWKKMELNERASWRNKNRFRVIIHALLFTEISTRILLYSFDKMSAKNPADKELKLKIRRK